MLPPKRPFPTTNNNPPQPISNLLKLLRQHPNDPLRIDTATSLILEQYAHGLFVRHMHRDSWIKLIALLMQYMEDYQAPQKVSDDVEDRLRETRCKGKDRVALFRDMQGEQYLRMNVHENDSEASLVEQPEVQPSYELHDDADQNVAQYHDQNSGDNSARNTQLDVTAHDELPDKQVDQFHEQPTEAQNTCTDSDQFSVHDANIQSSNSSQKSNSPAQDQASNNSQSTNDSRPHSQMTRSIIDTHLIHKSHLTRGASQFTNSHNTKFSSNPFYKILKEFIQLLAMPLQCEKASDRLLLKRRYADLMQVLGYVAMNSVAYETLCVRSLRAMRHVWGREGSAAFLEGSDVLYCTYACYSIFREQHLDVMTESFERDLENKTMDVFQELIFLMKDFSMLRDGALGILAEQMLDGLVKPLESTYIVRDINAPGYVHDIVEIVWNVLFHVTQHESVVDTLEEGSGQMRKSITLNTLRQQPRALSPVQDQQHLDVSLKRASSELEKDNNSEDGNQCPFNQVHAVDMDREHAFYLLSTLLHLYGQLQQNSTNQADRCLKNDVLVIFTLFASNADYRPLFKDVGVLREVCSFFQREVEYEGQDKSSFTQKSVTRAAPNRYSPPHSDSETILLMFHLMNSLAYEPECLDYMISQGYLAILLNYVDLTCIDLFFIYKWSEDQLSDIRVNALQSLFFFSQLSPQSFSEGQGGETLLEFLSHIMSNLSDDENAPAMVRHIQAALLNFATTSDGSAEMTEKSGFSLIFDIVSSQDEPTDDDISAYIQQRTVLFEILSWMVMYNKENQSIFAEKNGVQTVLAILDEYANQRATISSLLSHNETEIFIFCVIHCLWKCVIGNDHNEEHLISSGGMELLMDILDEHEDFVKYNALSIVADLVQNREGGNQFMSWVSRRSKKSAVETLVQLWNSEGQLSERSAKARSTIIQSFFGCNRQDLDFRIKIYSVLAGIGFEDDRLSHRDRMTLTEIKRYGQLLENRAWAKVREKLAGERLTSADASTLRRRKRLLRTLEDSVESEKGSIKDQLDLHDREKENEFFAYIQNLVENQKQEQKLNQKQVSILEQKRMKDRLLEQARS